MRHRRALSATLLLFAALSSCGRDSEPITAPPPVPTVLLKDIVIDRLPAPFYHFEYDASGKMTVASFASGLTMYDLSYSGGRLSEMRNNILVNKDRLKYFYDNVGRVSEVDYVDATGVIFTRVHFGYHDRQLVEVERERLAASGFVVDKMMFLSYDADGNLFELTEHRPLIAGVQD